jgi:hypothetical protein
MQLIIAKGRIAAIHDDNQEIDVDRMYPPAGTHSVMYVPNDTKIDKESVGDNPPGWKTVEELGLKQADVDAYTRGIVEDKMIDLQRNIDACDNVSGVDLSAKKVKLQTEQNKLKTQLNVVVK